MMTCKFQLAMTSKTVLVLWDIENVSGNPKQILAFIDHFKQIMREYYEEDVKFRIQIFHNPHHSSVRRFYVNQLIDQGITFIDTGGSGPEQADYCIKLRITEVLEDLDPNNCVVVLISGDGGFALYLEFLNDAGFKCYLICNVDSFSSKFKQLSWLNIWSYYAIINEHVEKIVWFNND